MKTAALKTGALLLFHGKSAVLTDFSGEKLEIRIEGGNTKSVRVKDVEYLHQGPVSALPPPEPGKPDLEGTWELMEEETLPFGEFAELLYSDGGAGAFYGAWKLLQEGIWFKGTAEEGVVRRPKAEIDSTLAAMQAKADAKKRKAELTERLRAGKLLPEDRPYMSEIEQVAFGINPESRLLKELGIESIPEKAHALLLKLGVWDETVDPIPARMKIDMKDPDLPIPTLPDEVREDLTALRSYAIDNKGSNDPDDAIGFSDGLLWVHVADPAAVVTPDSELDLAARNSGENLYLPEKVLHMLPPAMTDVFGLGLAETSPALSFGIEIDDEGHAHLKKFCLSTVKVERLTYETASPLMEQEDFLAMRQALSRFRDRRVADGAVLIQLPETDLSVVDGKVQIRPVTVTPERELVANAMLAAGAAWGEWASEHVVAFPFAAQADPEPFADERESLSGMYKLRKCCSQGYITSHSQRHAGLGLDAYIRVTSPLRRYADLLSHQQIRRILAGEEPFTSEEIDERYPAAEKEGILRRKTERRANEFWTLVYLNQNAPWTGKAVVVDHPDERTAFLIPELAYEFKSRGFGRLPVNTVVNVKAGHADIAFTRVSFRITNPDTGESDEAETEHQPEEE